VAVLFYFSDHPKFTAEVFGRIKLVKSKHPDNTLPNNTNILN